MEQHTSRSRLNTVALLCRQMDWVTSKPPYPATLLETEACLSPMRALTKHAIIRSYDLCYSQATHHFALRQAFRHRNLHSVNYALTIRIRSLAKNAKIISIVADFERRLRFDANLGTNWIQCSTQALAIHFSFVIFAILCRASGPCIEKLTQSAIVPTFERHSRSGGILYACTSADLYT